MSLKFRILRSPDIFMTMPCEAKGGNLVVCIKLDSLVVEVSESRPISSSFVRLAFVVVWPSASLTGLLSSSSFNEAFFLVTAGYTSATDGRSEPKILFDAEPMRYTRFSPLRLLR